MPSSVEARLRALEDRDAIADLVHEYARLADECEPERVAALFSEDACADFGPGLGAHRGRAAIERFFQGLHVFARTSHHVSNLQVRFEGDGRARGIAYVLAWHELRGEGAKTASAFARYEDEYVRTEAGWRFAARRVLMHGHENFDAAWRWLPRKEAPR